jgi:uncharacterized membrane protein (UPF0127 family)
LTRDETALVKLGKKTYNCTVSKDSLSQARGLMGRTLSEGEGMLFVFKDSSRRSFWMMGMVMEIEMVFISENLKVVDINHALPLSLNPSSWKLYRPKKPARYVLEILPGSGIKEGDKVSIDFI